MVMRLVVIRFLIFCAIAAMLLPSRGAVAGEIEHMGFGFSDEKGGFELVSVTGTGGELNPFVITERLTHPGPVTLVIRRLPYEEGGGPWGRNGVWTALYIRIVVTNESGVAWSGFDLELQEIAGKPSEYDDGLSFDQGREVPPSMGSDSFGWFERQLEPYDRVRFARGAVDPGATAHFQAHITDPTPVERFYLVQDPQILFATLGDLPPGFPPLTSRLIR